ncbi:MAG: 2-oxoacid:acceptor oxidoreductase family protein [Deltaproteobacteria bacterium]|nr:2-oxoacid:acceptor oxidoreductase family protein [Deltaproteobacteria bacterium]
MSAATIGIRIGGEAGQGVILAGVILAEAAAAQGSHVAQSARYGAAVRGGECTADMVVSSEPIDFPHVEEPDHLVVLSQETYDRLAPAQRPGTLVIYDPFFVTARDLAGVRQVRLAATDTAIRELGSAQGANLIVLGALAELTGAIREESIVAALDRNMSRKHRQANLKAIALGREMARAAGADA